MTIPRSRPGAPSYLRRTGSRAILSCIGAACCDIEITSTSRTLQDHPFTDLVNSAVPFVHVAHIVGLGARDYMARTAAQRSVAGVVPLQAFGKRLAICQLPGNLVGHAVVRANPECSVLKPGFGEATASPGPAPVRIGLVHLAPETIFQTDSNHSIGSIQ